MKFRVTFQEVTREVHKVTEECEIVIEAPSEEAARELAQKLEDSDLGCWHEIDYDIVSGEVIEDPSIHSIVLEEKNVVPDYTYPVSEEPKDE